MASSAADRISFYTFTQIAFIADAARGKVKTLGFVEYVLFVTWFPHLVAGPILHHAERSPVKREATVDIQARNIAIGLAIFSVGLAKKILIADNLAPYANAVFAAPGAVSAAEAWLGVIAYTMQLYFDFSGYSDMAIGLSRMFNVDLPLNFYSPYKATSIVEFWRRWHISLSRFLRDYLYIPLGGNRVGPARRYLNLLITMILGGLWHGAAWTFVIWGALHGLFLLLNHAWVMLNQDGVDGASGCHHLAREVLRCRDRVGLLPRAGPSHCASIVVAHGGSERTHHHSRAKG